MKLQKPSDFSRLVRNARAHLGFTQQDVAEAVGITRQSLARLERGNGGISFDTVILVLDHLGIQLEATPISAVAVSASPTAAPNAAQAAASALGEQLNSQLVIPGAVSLKMPEEGEIAVEPLVYDGSKDVDAEGAE